jgi:hypothetical protein
MRRCTEWLQRLLHCVTNTGSPAKTQLAARVSGQLVLTSYFLHSFVMAIPDLTVLASTFPIPHIAINSVSIPLNLVVSQHSSAAYPALDWRTHAVCCSLIDDLKISLADCLRCFTALSSCLRCSAVMRKLSNSAGALSDLTVRGCAMLMTVAMTC